MRMFFLDYALRMADMSNIVAPSEVIHLKDRIFFGGNTFSQKKAHVKNFNVITNNGKSQCFVNLLHLFKLPWSCISIVCS